MTLPHGKKLNVTAIDGYYSGRSRKRTRLGREKGVRFLMLLLVAYGIGSFFRPLEVKG